MIKEIISEYEQYLKKEQFSPDLYIEIIKENPKNITKNNNLQNDIHLFFVPTAFEYDIDKTFIHIIYDENNGYNHIQISEYDLIDYEITYYIFNNWDIKIIFYIKQDKQIRFKGFNQVNF
jgi:hypothetical protein